MVNFDELIKKYYRILQIIEIKKNIAMNRGGS